MQKKLWISLSLSLATFYFISCNNQHPEQKAAPVMETTETAEEGIKMDMAAFVTTDDLVCGMSIKDGIGDTATYDGKLYGFCATGCKEDFLKEPGKYIK